jgi:hypothetical protein
MYPPLPPTRENRSPLPHISHDPRILVRLFAHRNSLSHYYRTLFSLLDSQSRLVKVLFSPTLARNTVHRHAHYRFFFFSLPENLTITNLAQCHHTTSQAARSLENKKQPNERASLRRVCALLVILDSLLWSGHSLTHAFSLTVRDTHSTPAG